MADRLVAALVRDAREQAERSAKALANDGAEAHLVDTVRAAEVELAALHRRLLQATHSAVPKGQMTLQSVGAPVEAPMARGSTPGKRLVRLLKRPAAGGVLPAS